MLFNQYQYVMYYVMYVYIKHMYQLFHPTL